MLEVRPASSRTRVPGGNYSRLEPKHLELIRSKTGQLSVSTQSGALSPTFQSTISKVLVLQSIVHPSCPLAVQTSPYFLFNSFASRKSDSNTSPRKHKYASAGAAFYIVPVLHLSSLSEEKFGPQSGLSRKHK